MSPNIICLFICFFFSSQTSQAASEVKVTKVFKFPIKDVYNVIGDFRAYPDFVKGVKSVDLLMETPSRVVADYSVRYLGAKFDYVLDLALNPPYRISWELDKTKTNKRFNVNQGVWELSSISDSETKVDYFLKLELKSKFYNDLMKLGMRKEAEKTIDSFREQLEN